MLRYGYIPTGYAVEPPEHIPENFTTGFGVWLRKWRSATKVWKSKYQQRKVSSELIDSGRRTAMSRTQLEEITNDWKEQYDCSEINEVNCKYGINFQNIYLAVLYTWPVNCNIVQYDMSAL